MTAQGMLARVAYPFIYFVCAGSVISAMAQTIINVKDLGAEGITLTASTSPDFNTRVTALIGTPSGVVAALMPYSVVLTNSTTRTIRGYALRWKGFDRQGNPTYSNLQIEQNFDTRVSSYELPPGRARALSPIAPLDAPPPKIPSVELNKLALQDSLTVTLDSIAFDDGKVIGPNEGFATNVWSQMYTAHRDIGQSVLNRQAQGAPAADILMWLEQKGPINQLSAGSSVQESLSGTAHWYYVYANMALSTLISAGKKSPEKMFAAAQLLAQTPVPALIR